jgi:hypothetical protein
MMEWLILVGWIVGMFFVFIVTEFRMAQVGVDTYEWIQRLYNRFETLQRINW